METPRIWVTSHRKGCHLRVFDAESPKNLPVPFTSTYVGRKTPELPGSPLANPFRLDDEADRERVIRAYRHWLWGYLVIGTPQHNEVVRILRLSLKPEGVALACWCAPKACHAQVIREAAIRYYEVGWR